MSSTLIARYVTPWKFRREQEAQRLHAIRQRDGDDCRRCRRPMRFDLPAGHDSGPKVEIIVPATTDEEEALDNLCLCHRRCNAENADFTREVQERVRRKNEAELFSRSRRRAAKRA
jgi:hypothetical protein